MEPDRAPIRFIVAALADCGRPQLSRSQWFVPAILVAAILSIVVPLPVEAQIAGTIRRAAAQQARKAATQQDVTASARRAAAQSVARPLTHTKGAVVIENKRASRPREEAAGRLLKSLYPSDRVQPETALLNRNGRRAIDPKTGKGRRVDFVLFSRDGSTRRVEVTSQKASKTAQLAKELRIFSQRKNGQPRTGAVYVLDRTTGKLVPVKPGPSEVKRFM